MDQESTGGRCDDGRSRRQARNPRTPWCGIERALDEAPPGATVLVHAGRYDRIRALDYDRSSAPVTFQATDGEAVSVAGLTIEESSGLRFVGLHFTEHVLLRQGAASIEISGGEVTGGGVWLNGVRRVRVERNHVHDIPAGLEGGSFAIRVGSDDDVTSSDIAIRGNRLERLPDDAIQLGGAERVVVERNTIRDVHPGGFDEHADAIQVLGGSGIAIRANEIRDVQHGLIFTTAAASDVVIENNLVAGVTAGYGLKTEGEYGMSRLRVINNTWADTRYGEVFRAGHDDAVVRNNIFDHVDGLASQPVAERNLVAKPAKGFDYGDDSILEAPTYRDPAAFELAPGSAGVDAGAVDGAPRTDRLGRPRTDEPGTPNTGTGSPPFVDVGAHEVSAS